MIFVVSDLHGSPLLVSKTAEAIGKMQKGDTLIINGDGIGTRGPRVSRVVSLFYDIRRGLRTIPELEQAAAEIIGKPINIPADWVYKTPHSGVFLKLLSQYPEFDACARQEISGLLPSTLRPLHEAAKGKVKLVYLPGNGEIAYADFVTDNIEQENTLPPEKRLFHSMWKLDLFRLYGVYYVPKYLLLRQEIALVSTNLLDIPREQAAQVIHRHDVSRVKTIIVHYPPSYTALREDFDFWQPNRIDIKRIMALKILLREFPQTGIKIIFGHVHLGSDDIRMEPYPPCLKYIYRQNTCVWTKPGEVLAI